MDFKVQSRLRPSVSTTHLKLSLTSEFIKLTPALISLISVSCHRFLSPPSPERTDPRASLSLCMRQAPSCARQAPPFLCIHSATSVVDNLLSFSGPHVAFQLLRHSSFLTLTPYEAAYHSTSRAAHAVPCSRTFRSFLLPTG